MDGDGNCLFRCFAYFFTGNPANHLAIRREIVSIMSSHRDTYEKFMEVDGDWKHYIEQLYLPGVWAGAPCIHAATEIYTITVKIFTTTAPVLTFGNGPLEVNLAYIAKCHYDAVVNIDVPDAAARQMNPDRPIRELAIESLSKRHMTLSQSGVQELIRNAWSVPHEEPISLVALCQDDLSTEEKCIAWLRKYNFFQMDRLCPHCITHNEKNALQLRAPFIGHPLGELLCKSCGHSYSVTSGTMLANTKMSFKQFFITAIGWLLHRPYKEQVRDSGLSERALSSFSLKLNYFAMKIITSKKKKLGGDFVVVEIDEAQLHRRKYNKGRSKEDAWVIGGVERPLHSDVQPKIFMTLCPDRQQETLESIICQWVEPASIIVTDSFRSYDQLPRLGYFHYSVNHKAHFVDPESKAHTQRIEGLWRQVRKNAIPSTGCAKKRINCYLAAFLYRRTMNNRLEQFLRDLASVSSQEVQEYMTAEEADDTDSSTQSSSSDPPPRRPAAADSHSVASESNDTDSMEHVEETQRCIQLLKDPDACALEQLHATVSTSPRYSRHLPPSPSYVAEASEGTVLKIRRQSARSSKN